MTYNESEQLVVERVAMDIASIIASYRVGNKDRVGVLFPDLVNDLDRYFGKAVAYFDSAEFRSEAGEDY